MEEHEMIVLACIGAIVGIVIGFAVVMWII